MNKSRLFILPSLWEGCPKVLLEAMASGIPVIGSSILSIKEIIIHKQNGYLCNTDSISIKRALVEVLNDNILQRNMAENARKTILEKFSLVGNIKKEGEIYKNI